MGDLGDLFVGALKLALLGGVLVLELLHRGRLRLGVALGRLELGHDGCEAVLRVVHSLVRVGNALRSPLRGLVELALGSADVAFRVRKLFGRVVRPPARAVHEVAVRPKLLFMPLLHGAELVLEPVEASLLGVRIALGGFLVLRRFGNGLGLLGHDGLVIPGHLDAVGEFVAVVVDRALDVTNFGLHLAALLGGLSELSDGAYALRYGTAPAG